MEAWQKQRARLSLSWCPSKLILAFIACHAASDMKGQVVDRVCLGKELG
jgi:hypothetical protein